MSWGVYNIFLTPAHNWIHNCIQDWTREWDPALNTSTVWPNHRQGIIAMLSGGTVGRLCNPSQGERMNVRTLMWRLLALLLCFLVSPYFCFPEFPLFRVLTVWPSSVRGGPKIQAMPGSALVRSKLHNLMVTYLTDARMNIVTSRERLCELGAL